MLSFNMGADKWLSERQWQLHGFFLSIQRNECIPFNEKNIKTLKFATEAALEVIGALDISGGKEFLIPVPSIGITAEERLRLKRFQKS